jgi:hypothetical protein
VRKGAVLTIQALSNALLHHPRPSLFHSDNVLTAECYKEVRTKISCASGVRRDCSLNPSGFHKQQEWHSTIATQGRLNLSGLHCT